MHQVLITTDFSRVSRHSLDYICTLLQGRDVTFHLLHIYSLPVSYAASGVAVTAISHSLDYANDNMDAEIDYAVTTYLGIHIVGHVVTGNFLETLQEELALLRPMFMVLGTAGFEDIHVGDEDPLEALRTVNIPVLFIPYGSEIRPITRVAYACDYAGVGAHTPITEMIEWIKFMHTRLDVVHSDINPYGADDQQIKGEAWLKDKLEVLQPSFNWEQNTNLLDGIVNFVSRNDIDCVAMVPKKSGMWERLFRQSRTKALARLNKIAVIAFSPKQG